MTENKTTDVAGALKNIFLTSKNVIKYEGPYF